MPVPAHDIVPISEASSRLLELAEEVVAGAEKILTKNGSAYVAIVDAGSWITTTPSKQSTLGWSCWVMPSRGWRMHSQAGCSPRQNSVSRFGALVKGRQDLLTLIAGKSTVSCLDSPGRDRSGCAGYADNSPSTCI